MCSLCYELHQRELKLIEVEQEFADVTGVVDPTTAVMKTAVPPSLAHVPVRVAVCGACAVFFISFMYVDVRCICFPQRQPPHNMTLCRVLVVLHSLHDVPTALFKPFRDSSEGVLRVRACAPRPRCHGPRHPFHHRTDEELAARDKAVLAHRIELERSNVAQLQVRSLRRACCAHRHPQLFSLPVVC